MNLFGFDIHYNFRKIWKKHNFILIWNYLISNPFHLQLKINAFDIRINFPFDIENCINWRTNGKTNTNKIIMCCIDAIFDCRENPKLKTKNQISIFPHFHVSNVNRTWLLWRQKTYIIRLLLINFIFNYIIHNAFVCL